MSGLASAYHLLSEACPGVIYAALYDTGEFKAKEPLSSLSTRQLCLQARSGSLMSGWETTMLTEGQSSRSPGTMPDGNPFADDTASNMMRTLPSLQASFTSAGVLQLYYGSLGNS